MLSHGQQDLSLRLQTQRLDQKLVSAEKKLQEYEALIETLYHSVCEHCKGDFQRIAGAAMVSPPAAGRVGQIFSPSTPLWLRLLQGPLTYLFTGLLGATVSSESSQPGVFVSSQSCTPSDSIKSDWLVKYDDDTVPPLLKVEPEHVWTHDTVVHSVEFSPNGRYLAAALGKGSGKTYIYNTKTKETVCVLADLYAKKERRIHCLSFSPDDRYLATGREDGRIVIWDIVTKRVRNIFHGHKYLVNGVEFSPNGRLLVSCSNDNTTRMWSMRDGSSMVLSHHASGQDRAVTFSPDGKQVATSDYEGLIRLWHVRRRKLIWMWKAHKDPVRALAFTPNAKGLVSGSADSTLKYWDDIQPAPNGPTIESNVLIKKQAALNFRGHAEDIWSVATSQDGKWVVSGSNDGTARLWNIFDASVQCTLQGLGHKDKITSVDFRPKGNHIACGRWDGSLSMWKYSGGD